MSRLGNFEDYPLAMDIARKTGMDILCEILSAEMFMSLYPYQNLEWRSAVRSIVIAHELYDMREWPRARKHIEKDLRVCIKILMSKEGMRTVQNICDRMGKVNQEWFKEVKEMKLR